MPASTAFKSGKLRNSIRRPESETVQQPIKPSRRQALLSLVALWLSPMAPVLSGPAEAQRAAEPVALLNAYVDVLLPADHLSPAASRLGVGQSIWSLAADQPLLAELILRVAEWLDQVGGVSFADLSPEDHTAVVTYMEKADANHLEGRFFQLIRLLAIEFYYAEPEAIAGLALNPAPQPEGYPLPWS